jgi:predicted HicB family RNase H-like nuclease
VNEQAQPQQLSEEFYIRVNDVLEGANRIERRFDSHHAELVLLHAFSRYSAHHYLSTEKQDSAERRQAFAAYIARGVEELVHGHIAHMAGEPKAPEAAEPAAE